jgi:imidazolonepropionase-like amidohydrolase
LPADLDSDQPLSGVSRVSTDSESAAAAVFATQYRTRFSQLAQEPRLRRWWTFHPQRARYRRRPAGIAFLVLILSIGVKIATGADNYYEPESVNRISVEVEQLVLLGMGPFQALQSATVSAAELLVLADRTGIIAPGFEADMILLPSNPLQDVGALQDILMVVSNGEIVLQRIPFAKNS